MGTIDPTVFVNFEKEMLNNQAESENTDLDELYKQLGKAYYEGAFEDPLPQLLPLFEKITLLKNPPEPVEERCPNCGKVVSGANFCGNCGTKLK